MFRQLTLNLNFPSRHIRSQKIKQVRIFENLICHV